MIKKIYQELKVMVRKKFITKEIFKLLSELPESRLKNLCATLMYNIIFLQEEDVKELIECKKTETFERKLNEIRNRIENENIDSQIKQMQYVLSKLVGLLEFKKNDDNMQDIIYEIILSEVMYPLAKMLKDKKNENKHARSCFNVLKNEIFQ